MDVAVRILFSVLCIVSMMTEAAAFVIRLGLVYWVLVLTYRVMKVDFIQMTPVAIRGESGK